MNLRRILAIYAKDAQWAIKNMKLMVLMLAPATLSLIIAKIKNDFLFTYSVFFLISFIGLFLTSYIITEEKRIGSLKALLVSPLTEVELIMGKFLFPLTVCVGFAMLNFALQGQLALLLKPPVFITLILASASICCIGNLFGLFFKNEQELGVITPFIFFAFIAGSLVAKGPKSHLHGYFPDFHLASLIDNYFHLSSKQLLGHVAFQAVFFLILFAMTLQYIRYFFSKDSDGRRLNLTTLLFLPLIVVFSVVSGRSADFFTIGSHDQKSGAHFEILTDEVKADIKFSSKDFEVKTMTTNKGKVKDFSLKSKNPNISDIMISVRDISKPDEDLAEEVKSKGAFIIAVEEASHLNFGFRKKVSSTKLFYATSFAKKCDKEAISFLFRHPVAPKDYELTYEKLWNVIKTSHIECIQKPI